MNDVGPAVWIILMILVFILLLMGSGAALTQKFDNNYIESHEYNMIMKHCNPNLNWEQCKLTLEKVQIEAEIVKIGE